MISSQNISNLNITGSPNGVNFNALDNNWITAKITNSYSTTFVDSNGVNTPVVLHGWVAMPSTVQGVILKADHTAGYGFVSPETDAGGTPLTITNPAVSLNGATIGNGTIVYVRLRSGHMKYASIYECITVAGGGAVTSVQCTGNYLYVTYE